MRNFLLFILIIIVIFAFLTRSCAPGTDRFSPRQPANFLFGIWHGWIAPISLVLGFFNNTIRIYEKNNIGWWYDLAYYFSIVGGFGGFAFFRRRR